MSAGEGPQHLDAEAAAELVSGRMRPGEAAYWQGHIADCPACRQVVSSERALAGMLALGDVHEGGGTERAVRVPELGGGGSAERRWAVLLGVSVGLNLLLLLAWLAAPHRSGAAGNRDVELPLAQQEQVARDVHALRALRDDPWVADDLETASALAQLLREGD